MLDDKYIELAIKYKNQLTYLLCFLCICISFYAGRSTKECPPKSAVCKDITRVKDDLFFQLEEERKSCVNKIRKTIDDQQRKCTNKIRQEVDNTRKNCSNVSCEICQSIRSQCKRRRRR